MDFVRTKSPKKTNKKHPLIFIGIFLVLVLLGILSYVLIYFLIPQTGRVNILLIGKTTNLLSYENDLKSLNIIAIPDKTYLPIAYGKGQVTSEALYKFAGLSKQKSNLLIITLREFLGLPIDGWLTIPVSYNLNTKEDFLRLKQQEFSLFNFRSLFNHPHSNNLSPLYLRRFFHNVNNLRPDKITFINLRESGIFTDEVLPDSSTILSTESQAIDSIIGNQFYEWKVLSEDLSITVINGTQMNGLATRAARIISNLGGKVIFVGESKNKTINCLINTPFKYLRSYTVKKLQKIFSCEISGNSLEDGRSDITITLGLNYNKEVSGSTNNE